MFCNKCGNPINQGEKFCGKCGNTMIQRKVQNTEAKPGVMPTATPVNMPVVKKTMPKKTIIAIVSVVLAIVIVTAVLLVQFLPSAIAKSKIRKALDSCSFEYVQSVYTEYFHIVKDYETGTNYPTGSYGVNKETNAISNEIVEYFNEVVADVESRSTEDLASYLYDVYGDVFIDSEGNLKEFWISDVAEYYVYPEVEAAYTALAVACNQTTDVPVNAVSYNGHWYCVYELNDFSDWADVEEFCSNKNGYPATISSKEENEFIHNYLLSGYEYNNVFFGLSKNGNSGNWAWSNGESALYENWDNENTSGNYAAFSVVNSDGKWRKVDFASQSGNSKAVIDFVSATSVLSETTNTHYAERVFDNDISTAWVEGVDGNGIGESLTITFDKKRMIEGFEINAGYQRSNKHYITNGRPSGIKLTFSDGTSSFYVLEDVEGVQHIQLYNPIATDSVVLTLDSVYSGTLYEDTAISEISFNEYQEDNYFICEWGE